MALALAREIEETSGTAATGGLSALIIVPATGEGPVYVPVPGLLLSARFSRQGSDLLLEGDGERVLIRGYFGFETPPDLASDEGIIPAPLAGRLSGPLAPGQYAQAGQPQPSEPIGRVETAEGAVTATRADGTRVDLQRGSAVYQGDVVETGANGAVGIVFLDNSVFSLAQGGRMTLDEMVYDPQSQRGTSVVSLTQGIFTFVSGHIAKADPDAMLVRTPVATIGVRGTLGAINQEPSGQMTAAILPEPGGVVGELVISTGGGTTVLNQPNQASQVLNAFAPPSPPSFVTAAFVQAAFGGALSALNNAASNAGIPPPANPATALPPDTQPQGQPQGQGQGEGQGQGQNQQAQQATAEIQVVAEQAVTAIALGVPIATVLTALIQSTLSFIESLNQQQFQSLVETIAAVIEETVQQTVQNTIAETDNNIFGTNNRDTLNGSDTTKDLVAAFGEADIIRGFALNDVIAGGGGNDTIYGGSGNDVIHGDTPDVGDDARTKLDAIGVNFAQDTWSAGNDLIYGDAGNDLIDGGDGNDTIYGDDADNAASGNDSIYGGNGVDTIYAGKGADIVDGEAGNDTIAPGNDTDNDVLAGSSGADVLDYGSSYDNISANLTFAIDGSGSGQVTGRGSDSYTGVERFMGGGGNDTFNISFGSDTTIFSQGVAWVDGGNGSDTFNFTTIADVTKSNFEIKGGQNQVLSSSNFGDTIRLTGSGAGTLNLSSQTTTTTIFDIEHIDISGAGSTNNALTIGRHAINAITDANDTLIVSGNSGDQLNLDIGWSNDTSDPNKPSGYTSYQNSGTRLYVDNDITINFPS